MQSNQLNNTVTVCVPTLNRPHIVERLLNNLVFQSFPINQILIVDASIDFNTFYLKEKFTANFKNLDIIKSEKGLTLQRNIGIDNCKSELILMLDDDVLLEKDCIEQMVQFLNSENGKDYAGIGGYITNEYIKPTPGHHKLYQKIGLFNNQMIPGTWMQCGAFVELSHLGVINGIYNSRFLPGCGSMIRLDIAKEIRPDSSFTFFGEDKQWTLRISNKYKLGVLAEAKLYHEHYPGGGRAKFYDKGYNIQINLFRLLYDCDPNLTTSRKLFNLLFQFIEIQRHLILRLLTLNLKRLPIVFGMTAGFLHNIGIFLTKK